LAVRHRRHLDPLIAHKRAAILTAVTRRRVKLRWKVALAARSRETILDVPGVAPRRSRDRFLENKP
jgi:hypothetical protein